MAQTNLGQFMAKISITSLTQIQSMEHAKYGKALSELACAKIAGFHLLKRDTRSTWRLRYRNFNNQQKLIKLGKFEDGNKDRLNAAKLALKYRQQILDGDDPVAEKQKKKIANQLSDIKIKSGTVGKYLEGTYTAHQARKANEGKHTIDMLSKHLRQWFELPMESITEIELKDWQATKEQAGLSHATIKRAFGAFRTMLRHAVREGVLEFDPSHKFQLQAPTAKEKSKKQQGDELRVRRMLTTVELAQIQKGIDNYKTILVKQRSSSIAHGKKDLASLENLTHPHWFFPFFRLAAYTGLRTGDLYSLTWQELNLQFKRLVKIPNKTKHHSDPITVNLPLDDTITKIMSDWFVQIGSPSSGVVFPSPVTGNQMDKKAHIKHWKKVLSLGEVTSDLDFYSLRHHYISRLVAGGIPLFTVARLAGHKTVKMIEQHYGHLAPNAAVEALAIMAGDFEQASVMQSGRSPLKSNG
jgi:integrase